MKVCECGCGLPAPIAKKTFASRAGSGDSQSGLSRVILVVLDPKGY